MKILCFTPHPCIDQNYLAPAADWGADATAESLEELASGKGVNWACNLGDLFATAQAARADLISLAPVPEPLQAQYRTRLSAHGVQPVFIDTQEPLRRHLTVIARGRSMHLRMPGRPLPATAWLRIEESLAPGRLLTPGDVLVIAGSFPPDAPLARFKQLLGRLRDHRVQVWLDCSGTALTQLHAEATVIKINADEFRAWMKKEKRKSLARIIANALRALSQLTHLAVTGGADGAYLAFRNPGQSTPLVIHGKMAAKSVVHPTGAGDCFGAALLWALTQGRQSPDALRLALAAATTAVEKGPQSGLDPGEIRVRGAQATVDEHPR